MTGGGGLSVSRAAAGGVCANAGKCELEGRVGSTRLDARD